MRIQESNITSTKCSKMTEEGDRRHGMNGGSPGSYPGLPGDFGQLGSPDKGPAERSPQSCSTNASGGRLKFFKDGKFILELARAPVREGERLGWVSVPRKTFWPPPAPLLTQGPRQESSTSLSGQSSTECTRTLDYTLSDDNSSVQSSPWQRDHCWKQVTPRHNISGEMSLYYCRPASLHTTQIKKASFIKRRRPFDTSDFSDIKPNVNSNFNSVDEFDKRVNNDENQTDVKISNDVKCENGVVKVDADCQSVYRKLRLKNGFKKIANLVQSLWDKNHNQTISITSSSIKSVPNGPRNTSEHAIVSPRKRILRELEKVSLEDLSNKRSRPKNVTTLAQSPSTQQISFAHTSTVVHPSVSASKYTGPSSPSCVYNGTHSEPVVPPVSVSRPVSSYSITSLLGHPQKSDDTDDTNRHRVVKTLKKSPPSNSVVSHYPMHETPRTPDPSPSPEHYRYRHNSIHGSPNNSRTGLLSSPNHNSSPPLEYHRYKHPMSVHNSPVHFSRHSSIHNPILAHQQTPQYMTHPHAHSSPSHPMTHLNTPMRYSPASPDLKDSKKTVKKSDLRYNSPTAISEPSETVSALEFDPNGIRPSLGIPYVPPYMFPGHYQPPPYYGVLPAAYRPNPMWMQYSLGGMARHTMYPCAPQAMGGMGPWVPLPRTSIEAPKEDPCTDVPLNLSKHGG